MGNIGNKGAAQRRKNYGLAAMILTVLAVAITILMVGSAFSGTASAATPALGDSPATYQPDVNGVDQPQPEVVANVTTDNESVATPLGYTYATSTGLASGTLNAEVDSALWGDPVTVAPGTIAVPADQSAAYNYTTQNVCMNPKTGAATSGCNEFSQPSNWVTGNWSTNTSVELTRDISPITDLPQLTADIAPLHAQSAFAYAAVIGVSIPVRDLSPVAADSYLDIQWGESGSQACTGGSGGTQLDHSPSSGSYTLPACASGVFLTTSSDWYVPPGPAGGLFASNCAYKSCSGVQDWAFGTDSTGVNVTTAGIPEALKLSGQDLNFSSSVIESKTGVQDMSIPLSTVQSVFGGNVPAYTNLTVGIWSIQKGSLNSRWINITALDVNGLQTEPYVPGVSAAADSGNHTGGWTGKWQSGDTNETEVVTNYGSIATGVPVAQQEYQLTALSPTWGATGWIGGNGYTVSVAQTASELPLGSTDGAPGVVVTPSSSSNVIPADEAQYQFYFRVVGNDTYNIASVNDATIIDKLTLAQDQYLSVTEEGLDNFATNEAWTSTNSPLSAYQNYATSSKAQYIDYCPATGNVVSGNWTGIENDTGATSGPNVCTGTMIVGPPATNPGGSTWDTFESNYTVAYTQDEMCTLFQSPACNTTGTSTNNTSSGGGSGTVLSLTGEWILIGLLVLAGILLLVFWGGEKEGRKGRPGNRGVGRLNSRGVSKRYTPRSKEATEHDAAGIAWMLLLGVFILGLIYAILAYGLFGTSVSETVAAAVSVGVGALLVIAIWGWEATKEVASG